MKKNDVQELLFIVFVMSVAVALFTDNGFFDATAFITGIAFGTMLGVDYLK